MKNCKRHNLIEKMEKHNTIHLKLLIMSVDIYISKCFVKYARSFGESSSPQLIGGIFALHHG